MENTQQLSSEIDIRAEKIETLKKSGEIVYKDKFERTHTISEATRLQDGEQTKVCGRIVFRRVMGKFGFMQIRDVCAKIQVSVGVNELDEKQYEFYKKMIDIGDFVGVEGEIYHTQTGEITVKAKSVTLLSKALRPLPEKFHGLVDQEQKYRQRYLDLISNETARQVFVGRSKVLTFLRSFLNQNGFMEVETPILQSAVCGASAKPFLTHHNALNKDCNLRIAPETYLKQVIAGGFDRVYEVAKCFRNEGMDTQHLQEFTMVEWYASYWNFEDNIKFYKKFIQSLLLEIKGTTKITYQGTELDFGKEVWPRVNYVEEMKKILGFDFLECTNRNELVEKVATTGLFPQSEFDGIKTMGGVIDYIYKRKIRVNIIEPTILYNYPAFLIPLARKNDDDSRIIDAFQILCMGNELAKAYSELVDPVIQRRELENQAKAKQDGDDEAMEIDEDFLLAMEHGMPPISGLGFGVDRLMTILFDQESIRDVVLFPMMKNSSDAKQSTVQNKVENVVEEKIDFSKVKIEPLFEDFVDFETFSKSDFRAVKVKECVAVPKSKKLLQFTLDDGTNTDRTILSGIHAYYEPEQLVGKTLLAITNLPPRAMMGIDSCGMLLSAVCEEDGKEKLNLIMLDNHIPAGAKLC